jgi:hypothetical protein
MCARGMSARGLVGHGGLCGPDLICAVSDAAPKEVSARQVRPFSAPAGQDPRRRAGPNKAVQMALGTRADSTKEILGLRA